MLPRMPAMKAKRPIAILRASQQSAISNRRIMSAVKQRNSKVIWRSERTWHMIRSWMNTPARQEKRFGQSMSENRRPKVDMNARSLITNAMTAANVNSRNGAPERKGTVSCKSQKDSLLRDLHHWIELPVRKAFS